MQNVFFIVGPTAVGKTELAVKLAERCGAEIVSADAYQIYRGLNLLTAKPTAEQQSRVPHQLISCVEPSEVYNVACYLEDARACMDAIRHRGRPVLVVGGNGLYVKALTHGLSPLPAAEPVLRARLEALTPDDLLARLQTVDPVTADVIDARNKRRLVRALEVCLLTGKPFSSFRAEWQTPLAFSDFRGVFLFRHRDELAHRIDRRVDEMFSQGVVEEVRSMTGHEFSATSRQIIGLADIRDHLNGQLDAATCLERIKAATRQYAKRQVTWFKRETCFEPVNLSEAQDATRQFEAWYSRYCNRQG